MGEINKIIEYFQGKLEILSLFAICFGKILKSWSCMMLMLTQMWIVMGSQFGMLAFIGSKLGNQEVYYAPMQVIY